MLLPPPDLDPKTLKRAVEAALGLSLGRVEFAPLGEDSWSYRIGDFWVSVRRDLRGHVAAAYEATCKLREAGLEFVLAPRRQRHGEVVLTVGSYPVVIFPYLPCTSIEEGAPRPSEQAAIARLFTRLHGAPMVCELPREGFDLPFEADLDLALEVATRDPESGPLSSALHRVLAVNCKALTEMRAEFERLALAARRSDLHFVLTHGEPIAPNILRAEGALLVCDWGELAWAPVERDWSHLRRGLGIDPPEGRLELMRLYDLRWALSEIAEYASELAAPHGGSADDEAMLRRLLRYLPLPPGAVELNRV
jgi:spectinomycin phosphotransferase